MGEPARTEVTASWFWKIPKLGSLLAVRAEKFTVSDLALAGSVIVHQRQNGVVRSGHRVGVVSTGQQNRLHRLQSVQIEYRQELRIVVGDQQVVCRRGSSPMWFGVVWVRKATII